MIGISFLNTFINTFMEVPHVKMETSEIVRASLNENEWVTSVDLTDTYFHIPIRKRCRGIGIPNRPIST